VEEEIVEVVEVKEPRSAAADIDDAPVAKTTFKEKLVALRPGALIGELLGTFVLAGVVIKLAQGGTIGAIGIALSLAVLVIVLGVVSGAHLNPAITIAQYVNRKVDGVKAVAFIIAQVLGAVLAFVVLKAIFDSTYDSSIIAALAQQGITKENIDAAGGLAQFAAQTPYATVDGVAGALGIAPFINVALEKGAEWTAFFAEILGSAIFGLGIGYAVFNKKKNAVETGLAVGVSLFAGLMIGGATVILNPAVAAAIGGFDWGGALFGTGAMTFWWPVFIYIFGTVVGMTAGFTIYRFILKDVLAKR
jgi:glycerol uptake facilitator-like aquaporin